MRFMLVESNKPDTTDQFLSRHLSLQKCKAHSLNTLRHTSTNRMNLYCTADWAALQLLMHDMLFTVQLDQVAHIFRVV